MLSFPTDGLPALGRNGNHMESSHVFLPQSQGGGSYVIKFCILKVKAGHLRERCTFRSLFVIKCSLEGMLGFHYTKI